MKNRKLRTQSSFFLFKNKIKTLPKTQNKLYLSVLTKINNRMDNIEAISPKPDELVENKNSRHPKGLWVLFGTEMGAFQLLRNESSFDALYGKFLIDKRS